MPGILSLECPSILDGKTLSECLKVTQNPHPEPSPRAFPRAGVVGAPQKQEET